MKHHKRRSLSVRVDAAAMTDWQSLHRVFATAFGYPQSYAATKEAWVECMTHLDDPQAQTTAVHCEPGQVIVLVVENGRELRTRHSELAAGIVALVGEVNERRVQEGKLPVLVLAFE